MIVKFYKPKVDMNSGCGNCGSIGLGLIFMSENQY
jgi:hypothetical protein